MGRRSREPGLLYAAMIAGGDTNGKFVLDKEVAKKVPENGQPVRAELIRACNFRPCAYITTSADQETQRKSWDETMAEVFKADGRVTSGLDCELEKSSDLALVV